MCGFLPELLSPPSAVLPPCQVIGLLDVFTPDESLDDFTDLWVLPGLWRANSGAGWRGFLGVHTIGASRVHLSCLSQPYLQGVPRVCLSCPSQPSCIYLPVLPLPASLWGSPASACQPCPPSLPTPWGSAEG